jgi:hypothetical protein
MSEAKSGAGVDIVPDVVALIRVTNDRGREQGAFHD